MFDALLSFSLATFTLVGSPGPATLSIAAVAAAHPVRRGIIYALGVMAGTLLVAALAASGVAGVLLTLPGLAPVLAVAGIGYIAWLAYRIATAPVNGRDGGNAPSPRFYGGLLMAVANPKAYAAFIAVYSGVGATVLPGLSGAMIKFFAVFCLILIGQTMWFSIGRGLSGLAQHPSLARTVNMAFAAALLIACALAAASLF